MKMLKQWRVSAGACWLVHSVCGFFCGVSQVITQCRNAGNNSTTLEVVRVSELEHWRMESLEEFVKNSLMIIAYFVGMAHNEASERDFHWVWPRKWWKLFIYVGTAQPWLGTHVARGKHCIFSWSALSSSHPNSTFLKGRFPHTKALYVPVFTFLANIHFFYLLICSVNDNCEQYMLWNGQWRWLPPYISLAVYDCWWYSTETWHDGGSNHVFLFWQ